MRAPGGAPTTAGAVPKSRMAAKGSRPAIDARPWQVRSAAYSGRNAAERLGPRLDPTRMVQPEDMPQLLVSAVSLPPTLQRSNQCKSLLLARSARPGPASAPQHDPNMPQTSGVSMKPGWSIITSTLARAPPSKSEAAKPMRSAEAAVLALWFSTSYASSRASLWALAGMATPIPRWPENSPVRQTRPAGRANQTCYGPLQKHTTPGNG